MSNDTAKAAEKKALTHYVAVALIERQIDGQRVYVNPGAPVYLDEDDAKPLLKLKAIRTPSKDEAELESLRSESATSKRKGKRSENLDI